MTRSQWPEFLFTIAVRFICGIVLGGLAGFVLGWRGVLRAFSHNNMHVPLVWLGACGFIGGLISAFTVPRWQTPWYKREPLTSQDIQRKTSTVYKVTDDSGTERTYHSLQEMPPEIRSEIEALDQEAAQEVGKKLSITATSQTGNVLTSKTIHQKQMSVYKITDDSGVERTYHSLDEMPPELRAAVLEAEQQSKT